MSSKPTKTNDRISINDADHLQQTFMRKAQKFQAETSQKASIIKTRNRFFGTFLALGVVGIYTYTLFAVKQEKFLDEIIELPENKE